MFSRKTFSVCVYVVVDDTITIRPIVFYLFFFCQSKIFITHDMSVLFLKYKKKLFVILNLTSLNV